MNVKKEGLLCDECNDIIEDPQYNAMSYEGKRICPKCYYNKKEKE